MRFSTLALLSSFVTAISFVVTGCDLGCSGGCEGEPPGPPPARTSAPSDPSPPDPPPSNGFGSIPPESKSDDAGPSNNPRCPSWRPTNADSCPAFQAVGGCRYELLESGGKSCFEICNCIVVNDEDVWECLKDSSCTN
jgi:hypothetical protein